MAYLNISGAETGDLSEVLASGGTVAAYTTNKRTGAYGYHVQGSTGYISFGKLSADGTHAVLGMAGSTVYATVYLKPLALSGSCANFGIGSAASGNFICQISVSNTGDCTLVGTTTSASLGTIDTAGFHRFDIKATKSGACAARVNGGTEQTVTGNAQNADYVICTGSNAGTDNVWDDIAISDSAYPGAGEVRILKPNGTGNYTAWTDGAGTAPTNVAEVPHDSDTSYITTSTSLNVETEAMDSAATAGVAGTIGTVKAAMIIRAESAGGDAVLRLRSSTTDTDAGSAGGWPTSYGLIAKLFDTDPATSAAWASSGIDGIEVGAKDIFGGIAVRITAIYAMVWCTGTPPGMLFPKLLRQAVRRAAYH